MKIHRGSTLNTLSLNYSLLSPVFLSLIWAVSIGLLLMRTYEGASTSACGLYLGFDFKNENKGFLGSCVLFLAKMVQTLSLFLI